MKYWNFVHQVWKSPASVVHVNTSTLGVGLGIKSMIFTKHYPLTLCDEAHAWLQYVVSFGFAWQMETKVSDGTVDFDWYSVYITVVL